MYTTNPKSLKEPNLFTGLIIDFFAGGGGASVGIEMALGRQVDIAINHDPDAIAMHKENHPNTLHLTEDIFSVDLQKYVKGRHVSLVWASPDCTSHSKAKGGKPRKKGLRILPWAVFKHARTILPDVIIMENVEEIQQWGPLDSNGYPIKDRRGEDYKKFITAMKSLGYIFECRELVAADYGAPTTRKRWYAIFRRDGKSIFWPAQTHNKNGTDGLKKWVSVSTVLDFKDLGKSIFGRKKPLAEKTMNRIGRGLVKFVFKCDNPFIFPASYNSENYQGKITMDHNQKIAPMLIQYHSETNKNNVRSQKVSNPIMTLDTRNRYALVAAFITKFYKTGIGQSVLEPLHTITTSAGHFGQVNIIAVKKELLLKNGINEEIAQKCTWISQFIIEYYGQGTGHPVNTPLHTIVTKDRFALITILGNEYIILDIFLRMLTPEELKRAQGFPKDYIINMVEGKKYPKSKQVARIGNSVVPIMAKLLVEKNCNYLKVGERIPNLYINDDLPQLSFM